MFPFFFHIDTFALVGTIVAGISTTLGLPSIDCNGIETTQCTKVFEQIIAEDKATGVQKIQDVDCGGKDKARCQLVLEKMEGKS